MGEKYGEIKAGRDKNTGHTNARTFIDLRSYIVPSAAAPTRILHTGNGHHKHPAHTLSLWFSTLSLVLSFLIHWIYPPSLTVLFPLFYVSLSLFLSLSLSFSPSLSWRDCTVFTDEALKVVVVIFVYAHGSVFSHRL